MRRTYFLAGLGIVAALALVSPALGGPSLKSLVEKEVAKQLSATKSAKGKRGPRGPAGPAGPAGAAGAAGATGAAGSARAYAFVDHFDCADPGYPDDCAPLEVNKGVTSVSHVSAGVFCAIVPGLSPTTAPAVASVDTAQSFPGNSTNFVQVDGLDSGVCPAGQYEFRTFDPADAVANVDTSFTFVIP